jgi:hypothetical protein
MVLTKVRLPFVVRACSRYGAEQHELALCCKDMYSNRYDAEQGEVALCCKGM